MITKKDLVIQESSFPGHKTLYLVDDKRFNRYAEPIFFNGEWHYRLLICYDGEDIIELSTNNINEVGLRKLLPMTDFAKLIKSEDKADYKDDPNGRTIRCGSVSFQKWDVSKLWNNKD